MYWGLVSTLIILDTLLKALHIPCVSRTISFDTISLMRRIFAVLSLYRSLCAHLISDNLFNRTWIDGTLTDRSITLNLPPLKRTILRARDAHNALRGRVAGHDGFADILSVLLRSQEFTNRRSDAPYTI